MYVLPVPLFKFRSLFNLAYRKNNLPVNAWLCEEGKKILFFPRGCYALSYIAKSVSKNRKPPVCFLPSYFCNTSLIPLRNDGAKIIFYHITENFSPDWADVKMRSKTDPPDMFVLVHYFGNIIDNTEAFNLAKETGCIIVEDGAHVLIPQNKMGKGGTISFFSPHKLLPMPPIAIASIPDSMYTDFLDNTVSAKWGRADYIWFAKRIIQKAAIISGVTHLISFNKHKRYESGISDVKDINSKPVTATPVISPIGKLLTSVFEKNIYDYAMKQKSNAAYFSRCLSGFSEYDFLKIYNKFNNETIPYKFPLSVPQNQISGLYEFLSDKGILVETWPDLPPEIIRQKNIFSEACDYRNSILFFPIHASITGKYINFVTDSIKEYFIKAEKI